jgi:hypothetical protein
MTRSNHDVRYSPESRHPSPPSMSAMGQLRTLHCLIGPVAGEPSAAPYQRQGPGDPANNYDCQRCFGLNAPLPPWACLQYQMEPQQSRGCYQNARLKIVIDARIVEYVFQSTGLPNKVRVQQQASLLRSLRQCLPTEQLYRVRYLARRMRK